MITWKDIIIVCVLVAGFAWNIMSNYAIRGNEMKHLKEDISNLKKSLCNKIDNVVERIERLENLFLRK